MDIKVNGKNVDITPRLESYVEKKVSRLDRYLPNIQEVRVDLNEERPHVITAQITLRHERGRILRAEQRSDDLLGSVEAAVDKMYRQIEKYKGKRARKGDAADQFSEVETAIQLEESEMPIGEIVRRKRFLVTPMTEEEAIDQLEMLGHDFFIFQNTDTGAINVLYRRHDANYGLLEPEI